MKVTIVRHGKTILNEEGRFSGSIDCELLNSAIEEAKKKQYEEGTFDIVYSSPLKRAIDTANLIYPHITPICNNLIAERNLGIFEGMLKTSIPPVIFEEFRKNVYLPAEVEEVLHVEQRVMDFITFLKNTHNKDDKILVVTHNGIIRVVNKILLANDKNSVDNLQCIEIEL